ncbi:hypothetical protein WDW37_07450 [Bdellovibrionota bacterium FG-1]
MRNINLRLFRTGQRWNKAYPSILLLITATALIGPIAWADQLDDNIQAAKKQNERGKNYKKFVDDTLRQAKVKQKSKECKSFRLVISLCQASTNIEHADAAKKMEDDVTKESGVVNKYARYKIGQQKVMSSQGYQSNLQQYKKLSGKAFDRKQCDENEPKTGTVDPAGNPVHEEVMLCGCEELSDDDFACSNLEWLQ